ncbi:SCO3374 family protein [Streptomyces sp. HMX87]|uniref:SCO3374 family protein n=1 Tax=Streptomyces sp. HMX87 TaxID=3390849 RepID=UPI003A86FD70
MSGTASVPSPRRPLESARSARSAVRAQSAPWAQWVRWWYESRLGWETAPGPPGSPVRLRVGVRFDVLDVPAEAGQASLGRLGPDSPVAVRGERMLLLVAAGSAEELPGLLDWLEWGSLPLGLTAVGEGGLMDAPPPPGAGVAGVRPLAAQGAGGKGAAVWLRPPVPGREVEASLPALPAVGGGAGAPDLVRLVDTVAVQCHRVRLRRAYAAPRPSG